jgi:hypothetical protein
MNFHDAVLHSLQFDWSGRKLVCLVSPVSLERVLMNVVFDDVRHVKMDTLHPWGRSGSINGLEVRETSEGMVYDMEIQSGDVIEIHAGGMMVSPRVG